MRLAELAWAAALVLLAIYEVWALATDHMTLSRAVWLIDSSEYGAMVPFLAGLLCGHFFWSGTHR